MRIAILTTSSIVFGMLLTTQISNPHIVNLMFMAVCALVWVTQLKGRNDD
jgi:apolipoprotein N-acyltransferase